MAKKYVLWVVHTDLTLPYAGTEFHRIHLEGVIEAMKTAQEVGMLVVYERNDLGGYGSYRRFLALARKNGFKSRDITIMKYFGLGSEGATRSFLKHLERKRIKNFEVIFTGHYADLCIYRRAKALKNIGLRPYLIVGSPVVYSILTPKEVRELFGKDRLITIQQLRKL